MALFGKYINNGIWDRIKNNGLPKGSGIEICEKCRYRVFDKDSSYLICAQHRIHVGANQVCGHYVYGEPAYVMT